MTSILVVCTGNICRSPIAEGLLRDALIARFGSRAPHVSSAGTQGWEGSEPRPESVQAAAERGVDISGHVAREITGTMVQEATLVLTMAREHRDAIGRFSPDTAHKTFTLKELGRLVGSLPPSPSEAGPDGLEARVHAADVARAEGFAGNPHDEDVVDPLGMPIESYRAVAWELDEWVVRLVDGLYGAVPRVVEA
jgi:low molecular weight protein-tyrosine phosphatase